MKRLSRCYAGLFALSLIALSTAPAPAVIQPLWGGGGGGGENLSGMYSGSVSDSALGSGTAAANLVHFSVGGGDPLGGWLSFTLGSTTYNNPTSAARHLINRCHGGGDCCRGGGDCCRGGGDFRNADCGDWGGGGGGGNNTVRGLFVMIVGSAACSFEYRAMYSPSKFTLDGNYQAVNGCSGESGSFALSQMCYYQEFGNLRRNTSSGPGPCT
ncbi:MAG TPA: hypothetical protein VGI19_14385 [Candidatus Cybelea sp.]